MRLLKVFLGLFVILGLLLVLIQNTDRVSVDLIVRQYQNAHLAVVMIITLAMGIFIGFAIALSSILTSKAEARILKGESKRLSDELNSLRNIAIEEGLYGSNDEED